jgi:Zn-dependent alcohol dehydrogenase
MFTREPLEDDFMIEMIGTGVCHTDISGYGSIYPRVLGHEGRRDKYFDEQLARLMIFK